MTTMTSHTGERLGLDRRAVDELRATFRGELVAPGDAGYDQHRRVWNGSIDRHPALIARCAGVADVIAPSGLRGGPGWLWQSAAAGTASPGIRSATTGW